jgi:hypothetical protein
MKFTCFDAAKVRFTVRRFILISSIIFVASCGGGSGGGGDGDDGVAGSLKVDADGFWDGTFTQDSVTYDLSAVIYDDKFIGISVDAGSLYTGNVAVDGSTMTGDIDILEIGGGFDHTTSVTATVVAGSTIDGTTADAAGTTTFALAYNDLWDRDPDLATVAGIYLATTGDYTFTMAVAIDGSYFGSDTDFCVYSGTITPFDTTHNYYQLTMTVTDCGAENNGTYAGTTFLDDFNVPNDVLVLIIDDPSFILIAATVRQ